MGVSEFVGYARKFLVAVVAALAVLGVALADGVVTGSEWTQVVVAALGAVGVYVVKNDPE